MIPQYSSSFLTHLQGKIGSKFIATYELLFPRPEKPTENIDPQKTRIIEISDQNNEMIKSFNVIKFKPIMQAFKRGKFEGLDEEDFKEIVKYI